MSLNIKSQIILGEKVLWYDFTKTTSTMDYAVEKIREGCDPWTIVSASEQTSGRGTQGRTWFSPGDKGLWLSVVLPPPLKPENLGNLSVLAAQSLVKSFNEFTELQFDIKLPNDVIIKERKIAGILCESATINEKVISVVLGMGVNFGQSVKDFEKESLFDATSLLIETGFVPDREKFIISYLNNFKPMYEKLILKTQMSDT